MPDWITENAFMPFITGLLISGMLGSAAFMLGNRSLAMLATIVGICSIALVIVERYVVTDREQVRNLLYEVANDVEFNRHDAILAKMKKGSRAHDRAGPEMPNYKFRRCNVTGIRELSVDENANPLTASINFVVFIDVHAPTYQHDGPGRREVTLTFEKQPDGRWLIIDYSHRHPTGAATL